MAPIRQPPPPQTQYQRLRMYLGFKDPEDKITYIDCDCESSDHVFRLLLSRMRSDPPALYLEVQLHQFRGLLKRLIVASRYVAGYQSRYGVWDVTEIDLSNAVKMQEALKTFINERTKWAYEEISKDEKE